MRVGLVLGLGGFIFIIFGLLLSPVTEPICYVLTISDVIKSLEKIGQNTEKTAV